MSAWLGRQPQRLGGHVRVAVAVAADPLAHAREGRDALIPERLLDVAVQARDLRQEGGLVVGERVLDLVGHGQLGEAAAG